MITMRVFAMHDAPPRDYVIHARLRKDAYKKQKVITEIFRENAPA